MNKSERENARYSPDFLGNLILALDELDRRDKIILRLTGQLEDAARAGLRASSYAQETLNLIREARKIIEE